jgi:putative ABC transport system permease protein
MSNVLLFELQGKRIPEGIRALKELWAKYIPGPIGGFFLDQYINDQYSDITRQSIIFSAFAGVAVVVAALGLLGLAVFTAERQTKEIGLRKALGARRRDVLRLLGWRFARPVLLANIVAWPCAYLVMRRWLEGFAYHVSLSWGAFLGASGLALAIALATVTAHALIVARSRPVDALRYE